MSRANYKSFFWVMRLQIKNVKMVVPFMFWGPPSTPGGFRNGAIFRARAPPKKFGPCSSFFPARAAQKIFAVTTRRFKIARGTCTFRQSRSRQKVGVQRKVARCKQFFFRSVMAGRPRIGDESGSTGPQSPAGRVNGSSHESAVNDTRRGTSRR